MKTKKIYLVRHGQTDNNLKKILQGGNVDLSINTTGMLQAEAFYQAYKHIPFDKIYISTLKRTRESVQKFIDMGIPYEEDECLNEISFGIHDGKVPSEGKDSFYHLIVDQWQNGKLDVKLEGGESPLEVQARVKHFIIRLQQTQHEQVLVCMHGRAMRILLATALNYDLARMEIFKHANLGVYILNYIDNEFIIEKSNDCSHLTNLPNKI